MEEVREMKAQPQILLHAKISLDQIKANVMDALGVPSSNVFAETFPDDADFDNLFEEGYVLTHHFKFGVFATRLDGYFGDQFLTRASLLQLSEALGTLVCVDFSVSDLYPRFEAYFRGAAFDNVQVATLEDREGNPYYSSDQIRGILQGKMA
jgi:hypothetical protein